MRYWNNKSSYGLAPRGSVQGRILEDWKIYCSNPISKNPISKETLIYYFNTLCPKYALNGEKRWPVDGSLNYCIIKQLKQHCQ